MMKVRGIRARPVAAPLKRQLPTSTGTTDMTVSGLGRAHRQKALIAYGNNASSDGTAADDAFFGYGFSVSQLNRAATVSGVEHGDTVSGGDNDGHTDTDDLVFGLADSGGYLQQTDHEAFIDDGVQLDVVDAHTTGTLLQGLILSGDDVLSDRKTVVVATTTDGTADTTISFEPNLVVLMMSSDQFNQAPNPAGLGQHPGFATQTIGFCRNDKAGTVQHVSLSVSIAGAKTAVLLPVTPFWQS